jgi:hypothetical protein
MPNRQWFAARAAAPLYHLRNLTYGCLGWDIKYPYKQCTVRAFFAARDGRMAPSPRPNS